MASGNGYRFAGIQSFTTAGSYTYNRSSSAVNAILVYVTGSGGGGGGINNTSYVGGSGGAGGTAIKWIVGTTTDTAGNTFASQIASGISCTVAFEGIVTGKHRKYY